jgi:hypothetical protein
MSKRELLHEWFRVSLEIVKYDIQAIGNGSVTGGLGKAASEDASKLSARRRELEAMMFPEDEKNQAGETGDGENANDRDVNNTTPGCDRRNRP